MEMGGWWGSICMANIVNRIIYNANSGLINHGLLIVGVPSK
jgi:hypothetical protein